MVNILMLIDVVKTIDGLSSHSLIALSVSFTVVILCQPEPQSSSPYDGY